MENTPTIRNTIVNKYIMYSIAVLLLFAPAGFLALWGQKPEEAP